MGMWLYLAWRVVNHGVVWWTWTWIAYLPETADVAFDVAGDTLVYCGFLSASKGRCCGRCMYQSVAVASISSSYILC